jgi:hypothetical protein
MEAAVTKKSRWGYFSWMGSVLQAVSMKSNGLALRLNRCGFLAKVNF